MPFESGTYNRQAGKTVHFVRISDIKFVLNQLVEELSENDDLSNLEIMGSNTLYVTFLGDKGESSTKLMLQVLNTDSHVHSNSYAKMTGIFKAIKNTVTVLRAYSAI